MSDFGLYSISAELAILDQLKKIFYLLENYFKILVGAQVSDRCPLGYLSYDESHIIYGHHWEKTCLLGL